jgi:hypothetical protein
MKHYCPKLKKRMQEYELLKECTSCKTGSCNFEIAHYKEIAARRGTRRLEFPI